jgi:hypothetical protein
LGNLLGKSSIEHRNTHFIFDNLFSENLTVYEKIPKNMVETEGLQMTSQYGAYALHAVFARLHAHAHTPWHPHTRTHTEISNTYCFCTATMIREGASLLRYAYMAAVV